MPFLLALFACSDLVFTHFLVTLLQRHFLPTSMSYIYSEDDFNASEDEGSESDFEESEGKVFQLRL